MEARTEYSNLCGDLYAVTNCPAVTGRPGQSGLWLVRIKLTQMSSDPAGVTVCRAGEADLLAPDTWSAGVGYRVGVQGWVRQTGQSRNTWWRPPVHLAINRFQ